MPRVHNKHLMVDNTGLIPIHKLQELPQFSYSYFRLSIKSPTLRKLHWYIHRQHYLSVLLLNPCLWFGILCLLDISKETFNEHEQHSQPAKAKGGMRAGQVSESWREGGCCGGGAPFLVWLSFALGIGFLIDGKGVFRSVLPGVQGTDSKRMQGPWQACMEEWLSFSLLPEVYLSFTSTALVCSPLSKFTPSWGPFSALWNNNLSLWMCTHVCVCVPLQMANSLSTDTLFCYCLSLKDTPPPLFT